MPASRRRTLLVLTSTVLGGGAALLLGTLLGGSSASATPTCTDFWTGANSSAWNTINNWSSTAAGTGTHALPGSTDYACLATTPTRTAIVFTGTNRTVAGANLGAASLEVQGATLTLNTNATVVGAVTIDGGTLKGSASTTLTSLDLESGTFGLTATSGGLTANGGYLDGAAALTVTGTATICSPYLSHGYHLLLQGTSTLSTTTCGGFYLQNASTVENAGTLNVSGNDSASSYLIYDDATANALINDASGTINVAMSVASDALDIDTPFTNRGNVSVTKGAVQIYEGNAASPATDTGSYAISSGQSVSLESDGVTAGRTITGSVTGAGTLVDTGATLAFGTSTPVSNLSIVAGTVSGSPKVTTLSLTGGTLDGSGTLTSTGTATLCDLYLNDGYRLLLQGTSTFNTTTCGGFYLQNASTIENAGTLTMSGNDADNSYFVDDDSTGDALLNDASSTINISLSVASNPLYVYTPFSNSGTVNVTTGILYLEEGNATTPATDTGTYAISSGQSVGLEGDGVAAGRTIAGPVTGTGTLVADGATVTFGSGVSVSNLKVNYGVVSGSPTVGGLTLASGTLDGSGTLTSTGTATLCGTYLDDGYRVLLQGTSTLSTTTCSGMYLQNASTVENAGTLTVSGNDADNSYLINSDNTGDALLNDASATMNVSLSIASNSLYAYAPFSNSGTVNVTTGILYVEEGNATTPATDVGTYAISSGQSVSLDGDGVTAGRTIAGSVTGAGTLVANGATVTFGTAVPVSNLKINAGIVSGSPTVAALTLTGGTLDGSGTLTSTTTATLCGIYLNDGYRLLLQGTSTFSTTTCNDIYLQNASKLENSGTLNISGNDNDGGYLVSDDGTGDALLNDASGVVNMAMSTTSNVLYVDTQLTNNGTISVTKGEFYPPTVTNLTGSGKLTGGTWSANGGKLDLPRTVATNAATMTLGTTGSFQSIADGTSALLGLRTNQGALTLSQSVSISAAVANTGTLTVLAGTFQPTSYSQTAGTTTVASGAVFKGGSAGTGAITITGGTLTGSGTVTGALSGAGTVVPGTSGAGTLHVTGSYAPAAGGSLAVTATGTNLAVSGAATLGGTLAITTPAVTPSVGTVATIVTAGSRTGTFAAVTGQDVPGVGYWSVSYSATGATATLVGYPSVTVSGGSVNEGNAGTANLPFTLTLSAASQESVTVQYATSNGTAAAGTDYTAATGTATFVPGSTTTIVNVPVLGDTTYELNETVQLTISSPVYASLGATTTAAATIVNDDAPPSMSIGAAAASVGSASGTTMTYPVTLSAASAVNASASWATQTTGTAVAGVDYVNASGTITIPAGSTTGSITVTLLSQSTYSAPKTLPVTLSSPDANTALGTATGTGTITNLDDNLTSLSPASLTAATTTTVTLSGHNFAAGATVSVTPAGVTVSSVSVVNATTITATFKVATTAAPGARSVTLVEPGQLNAVCSSCLTIHVKPTVTSAAPTTVSRGAGAQTVTITGTNFLSGAKVILLATGQKTITGTNVVVVNSTQITASFTAPVSAALGARSIRVTNTDALYGTCTNCITVVGPDPTSVDTPVLAMGTTATANLTGTGFASGATVVVANCTVTNPSTLSATDIQFTIKCGVSTGSKTLTVTNPDGGKATLAGAITVVAAPTITSVSPSSMARGATVNVTITGTGFVNGLTLTATGLTFSNVVVVNSTSVTATVTVASNATVGSHTVKLTNPTAAGGGTVSHAVTVTA